MSNWMRHVGGGLLVLLAGFGWMPMASGQRLMVLTQTRNALGESTRLQLHSVDMDLGTVEPGPLPISGTDLAAPLLLDRQQAGLIVSSGPPMSLVQTENRARRAALSSVRVAPLAPWPDADNETEPGWREWAVDVAEDRRNLSNLLVTARLQKSTLAGWRGALVSRPWPPEGLPGRVPARGCTLQLPVGPRYVLKEDELHYVVVGSAGRAPSLVLSRVDMMAETFAAPKPFTTEAHDTNLERLRGAVLDPVGKRIWLLFSALVLGETGIEPTSWLHVLESTTLAPTGPPLSLKGVGDPSADNLVLDASGDCWVITSEPATDFAHVTRVGISDDGPGPVARRHWPLAGVIGRIHVAPEVADSGVVVSFDRRVEFWPEGNRAGQGASFEGPVDVLRWTEAGIVIAEGNRVHRLRLPDCSPEATVALQTGWPIDIMPVAATALPKPDGDGDGLTDQEEVRLQTRPDNPDSDGDGIPDGRDPHPKDFSPRLVVPTDIVFPYAAVGRQFRVLPVESLGAPEARWQIDFDSEALPWLRLHPPSSRGSGYARMLVDPERFDPSGVVAGELTVTLSGKAKGNRPGYRASGSPATVQIRVAPPRDSLPTILWLWPESAGVAEPDPDFSSLRDLLANEPYYFSHVSRYGPVTEDLAQYSIIILGAEAAAEGALTQKALLEYLNEGGALLFLGARLEGEHYRDLTEWFRPLDIQVDMETRVSARFRPTHPEGLLRHWINFPLDEGCLFIDRRDDASTIHIPYDSPERVVFAARHHGYGRVVLIAAPTPLQDPALANDQNKQFALDLFYWLSRAGHAVSDHDGDGLLDEVEDKNRNGAVDGGDGELAETNWLDPDTDDDGIPDGGEDLNRNGAVDPGETDPRAVDTDGDGTLDGADATPAG